VKKYNLRQSAVIVLVGFALLWIGLYLFVFPFLVGGGSAKVTLTRNDEKQLLFSIEVYRQELGIYPTGANSNILSVLSGNNSKKIAFINFRRTKEHPNEMVDSWDTPFQIELLQQTNFIIRSAGKDKLFGDSDDIIFNSVSNCFVQP